LPPRPVETAKRPPHFSRVWFGAVSSAFVCDIPAARPSAHNPAGRPLGAARGRCGPLGAAGDASPFRCLGLELTGKRAPVHEYRIVTGTPPLSRSCSAAGADRSADPLWHSSPAGRRIFSRWVHTRIQDAARPTHIQVGRPVGRQATPQPRRRALDAPLPPSRSSTATPSTWSCAMR
jgi:hypothetical protein